MVAVTNWPRAIAPAVPGAPSDEATRTLVAIARGYAGHDGGTHVRRMPRDRTRQRADGEQADTEHGDREEPHRGRGRVVVDAADHHEQFGRQEAKRPDAHHQCNDDRPALGGKPRRGVGRDAEPVRMRVPCQLRGCYDQHRDGPYPGRDRQVGDLRGARHAEQIRPVEEVGTPGGSDGWREREREARIARAAVVDGRAATESRTMTRPRIAATDQLRASANITDVASARQTTSSRDRQHGIHDESAALERGVGDRSASRPQHA